MESFLYLTAKDLYTTYGDQLADVAVIFPNNRARHFFSEHLYKLAGKPVWTPSFLTIQHLFRSQTQLQVADTLTLVARLYRIYLEVSGRNESFDAFYLWGEMLLSDFDDVDKNLADATQLFRNIKEQAAFTDTLEHLSEEQESTIRRFFGHFDPERKTELKQRFIENWNHLMQVYTAFRTQLEAEGLAYEGLLNRRVLEHLETGEAPGFDKTTYAFVGFNVLNQCEKVLFNHLQQAGKALFYWDYDHSYLSVSQHEAGRFMRQNLADFPNRLDKSLFNTFTDKPKRINLVASASENAQARYIPNWLEGLGEPLILQETAIVLGNENLLLPVLHSIPDTVSELNVTMGFPLNLAPVSNLVVRICQLHANGLTTNKQGQAYFHYRYVQPILQHPLIKRASPEAPSVERSLRDRNVFRASAEQLSKDSLLRLLFTPASDSLSLATTLMNVMTALAEKGCHPFEKDAIPTEKDAIPTEKDAIPTERMPSFSKEEVEAEEDPLMQESVFQVYTVVSHVRDALEKGVVEVGLPMFQTLLQRVLSVTAIPFSGEPVRGLQIMGLLETRNLDFKNVLLLSVNEGMLPRKSAELSFIPYNLRKGFGLTTADHKDSIFAYYFFRLLQRAETITLVYNTTSEGINRGEMSRFILQLLVESNHPIKTYQLHTRLGLSPSRQLSVEKTPALLAHMKTRFDQGANVKKLSPTAINTLLDCSLRFYFKYVIGLEEPDTVSDEIDGAMLGTFFHHAAEYLYTDLLLRSMNLPAGPVEVEAARNAKTINKALEAGTNTSNDNRSNTPNNNNNTPPLNALITASNLDPWIKGERSIDQLAEHVMRMDFFKLEPGDNTPIDYSGEQLIRHRLLTHFIKTLLRLDSEAAPFTMKGMERWVEQPVTVETSQGPLTFTLGGIIDRLHEKAGVLHVLDYKTGGDSKEIKTIEALFESSGDRYNYGLQILLYCALLAEQQTMYPQPLKPELLYVNKAGGETYSPDVKVNKEVVDNYAQWHQPLMDNLRLTLQHLFDPSLPFTQTQQVKKCEYCPYKGICQR